MRALRVGLEQPRISIHLDHDSAAALWQILFPTRRSCNPISCVALSRSLVIWQDLRYGHSSYPRSNGLDHVRQISTAQGLAEAQRHISTLCSPSHEPGIKKGIQPRSNLQHCLASKSKSTFVNSPAFPGLENPTFGQ